MKKLVLALMLTAVMAASLVNGMSGAWFSDEASVTDNSFGSGQMVFSVKSPGSAAFNVSNMKPGDVVTGYLVVANDSTAGMDMKWKAWIEGFGSGYLDDVLDVKVTMHPSTGFDYSPYTGVGYTVAGPVNHLITDYTAIQNLGAGNSILLWDTPSGPFGKDWVAVYQFDVKMRESTGNNYQNQTFTSSVKFYATQFENPGW